MNKVHVRASFVFVFKEMNAAYRKERAARGNEAANGSNPVQSAAGGHG